MSLIAETNFAGVPVEVHEQTSPTSPDIQSIELVAPHKMSILGGGVELQPQVDAPGNLLVQSSPTSSSQWNAGGLAHLAPSPATVRIGLVCAFVPDDQYTIAIARSRSATRKPSATATLPPGYVLVGGGGGVELSNSPAAADAPLAVSSSSREDTPWDRGMFLYASRPADGGWLAAAKDHIIPCMGVVTAYAIGVDEKWLADHRLSVTVLETASQLAAHPTASCAPTSDDELLLCGGAEVHSTGPGNLLTSLCFEAPVSAGNALSLTWTARAKDHFQSDPGTITTWALALVRQ